MWDLFWARRTLKKVVVLKSLTSSPFKTMGHKVKGLASRGCEMLLQDQKSHFRELYSMDGLEDAPKNFHMCSMKEAVLNV